MENPTGGGGWAAAWYPDPWFAGQLRYWDGRAWTPHVHPTGAGPAGPGSGPAPAWGSAPVPDLSPRWAPDPQPETPPAGPATPTEPWAPPAGAGPADPWASPGGAASSEPWAPPLSPSISGATSSTPAGPPPRPGTVVTTDPWAPPGGSSWSPGGTAASEAPTAGWYRYNQTGPAASTGGPAPSTWSLPTAPPPRRRGIPWVAVLVVMLVAVLVAAGITVAVRKSGSHSNNTAAPPVQQSPGAGSTPSQTTPSTMPGPDSTDPDASAVEKLVVTSNDAPSDDIVGLITGGNEVQNEATLDLCNGTYASESLRSAREQTAVVDSQGDTVFSTEAVLYDSANGTAEAFTELRQVAANCPSTPVQSPVGEPAVTTTFKAPPDGLWPQTATVERQAYDFTTTDSQGNTSESIAVYLRRGRVLEGLYFSAPTTPPTIDGQSTIPAIVTLFAKRIAALPASVVTRTVGGSTS